MLEYHRLDRILDLVLGATFTPVAKLSSILGVTDRTLRADISMLNATLEITERASSSSDVQGITSS